MKDPVASAIALELEWFRDAEDIVIGVLFLDIDTTYNYVVMGRDEVGQFRAIDLGIDYFDRDQARGGLISQFATSSCAHGMDGIVTDEQLYFQD